jgi:hypothetical protein
MERRRLLSEKVMDTIQDENFCLAGFTYSQQIAEKANRAKGIRTFEEMVPEPYRDFAKVFFFFFFLNQFIFWNTSQRLSPVVAKTRYI